jgi:hypothetical protein
MPVQFEQGPGFAGFQFHQERRVKMTIVNARNNITDQQIEDLLTTAFEGGINYWCRDIFAIGGKPVDRMSKVPTSGGILHLIVPDHSPSLAVLDKYRILKGIARAAAHKKQSVEGFLEDADAVDADLAVQFAAFGEIVFK